MHDRLVRDIVLLIIAFTCVGVFVATAVASVLDMFNLLKLAPDIRTKLHVVLIVEIVGICITAFSGLISPRAIVKMADALQKDNVGLTVGVNLLQASAKGGSTNTSRTTTDEGRAIQRTIEAARSISLQGARILWVDNNPQNNQSYERNALEQLGVHFVLAKDTGQAQQLLNEQSFQLVITDFARADDDRAGYTLLADIKGRQKAPPVIIYSGSATPEQIADAKTKGAFGQTNRPQELFNMAIAAIRGPSSPDRSATNRG